jgi:hypothetical protein
VDRAYGCVLQGINLWHRSWEEGRVESIPLVTLAAQWLRDNAPPADHVSMLHGDYRGGNFLFSPEGDKRRKCIGHGFINSARGRSGFPPPRELCFIQPGQS